MSARASSSREDSRATPTACWRSAPSICAHGHTARTTPQWSGSAGLARCPLRRCSPCPTGRSGRAICSSRRRPDSRHAPEPTTEQARSDMPTHCRSGHLAFLESRATVGCFAGGFLGLLPSSMGGWLMPTQPSHPCPVDGLHEGAAIFGGTTSGDSPENKRTIHLRVVSGGCYCSITEINTRGERP